MTITGLTPLFTQAQIAEKVACLGKAISAEYGSEPLHVVCVLKGAFVFFADLVRAIHGPAVTVDFVRISSYGNGMTGGELVMKKDVETDLAGKNVLIVEDLVDSGRSMRMLLDLFASRGAKSLRLAALIDKRARRVCDVQVDYAGFVMDDGFIVGYGLDYAEQYRALPDICTVEYTEEE